MHWKAVQVCKEGKFKYAGTFSRMTLYEGPLMLRDTKPKEKEGICSYSAGSGGHDTIMLSACVAKKKE